MSDYVLSASLELKDKFSSTITTAISDFKKMGNVVGNTASSVKKYIKNMNLSAKDIKGMQKSFNSIINMKTVTGTLMGSGFIGGFIKSSYMGYVYLNEQLTKNAAITGASAEEQAKLKKQVDDLGASTKFTALEVAQAQMYQAMAGYKTNEILEVTPTLMKLAIATGEDLAATSDMVTDNLSAFGLSVQDAGMFADLLANTANNTNTSVAMLGEAFKYAGTTSRSMGEDVKEVAVMLGIAADNGIKASQAGTGLRGIYARLSKPTKDIQEQLNLTNTELYDQNRKFKGLRKIIEESKPALEKLTAEQRNNWLATVAGTEGMSLWNAILNNSIESTEKAEKAAYNAGGALEKFVGVMGKTDRQKIDELSSAFDGFKRKLGEALSPIILENVQKLTTYLNDLTNSDELSTENITNFFDSVVSKAKWAAGAFLAAQIAFLGMRASMGDPTAIAQLGILAAAGIGLGVYGAFSHAENVNKDFDKSNKESTSSYIKKNQKELDYEKSFDKYNTTDASSTSYGAMQQLNYEKAKENAKFENEILYPKLYKQNLDNLYNKSFQDEIDIKPIQSFKEYNFKNELLKEENSINNVNENISNSSQEDNSSEVNNTTISENIYKNSAKSENIVNNEIVKSQEFSQASNTSEKTINLNLNLDVKGLENNFDKDLIKDITKEALYETFRDANMKYELRL